MFVTKVKLLVFVFSCYIFQSRGLKKLDLKENNIFVVAESAIRNITSKLFKELHLQRVTFSSKLRQYILVHNFLTSVTLKGQKTLNKIVELSRTDKNNTNIETEAFITILNEILNEDCNDADDGSSAYNDDNLINYIDEFLTNLDGFKENSGIVKDNYDSLEIKDAIIHILRSENAEEFNLPHFNVTGANNLEEDDSFLSDNEFWVPEITETRRIYRGDRTKIKHFPFMVSVLIFKSFQCGGSIVKSDLVITAASCVQLAWNNRFFRENPAFLSVRVGSNFYNGGGELIPIMEVYFPPEYNPKNLNHNIVVLRLLRKLNIRKKKREVKKIEIDRNASPLPLNTDGITIVGWGARSASNILLDPWSNQLAFAVLDVYHLQDCQDIYSREYVTQKNFCAGFISKGSGACNHDLGGPGIANGLLTGVISFGSPVCGTPDAPTVFTKVGFYAEWIDQIMDQEVPYARKKTTLRPAPFVFTPPPQHLAKTTIRLFPIIDGINELTSMNPIPIQQIDANLRILNDENMFKEYISTMFKSKEADEYQELINDNTSTNQKLVKNIERNLPTAPKKTKLIERVPEETPESMKSEFVTRMDISEDTMEDIQEEIVSTPAYDKQASNDEIEDNESYEREIRTKDQKADENFKREMTTKMAIEKYTVLDKNLVIASDDENDSLESDIVKLIDNLDVSVSVVRQEHSSGDESTKNSLSESTEEDEEPKYEELTELSIQEESEKPNYEQKSELPIQEESEESKYEQLTELSIQEENEKLNYEQQSELPIQEESEESKYEQLTELSIQEENEKLNYEQQSELPIQEESEEPKYEQLTKLPILKTYKSKKPKRNDDEVLTVLYLSESEISNGTNDKIDNANEDFDGDISEGMEIPLTGFDNVILKNNESTSVLDFVSKHELYDILSKAVSEVKNKK